MPNSGWVVPGNIDLYNRPKVKNPDGSISTVRSMSFNDGRHEVLIPTVHPSGYIMSDNDAINHYYKTGQHLGKFTTPSAATRYAQQLHNDYAAGKYDTSGLPVQLPEVKPMSVWETILGRR
jgi:hypothetical protein